MHLNRLIAVALSCALGCGPAAQGPQNPEPKPRSADSKSTLGKKPKGPPKPLPRPSGLLSLAEAERYMLALINHDREIEGLDPLEWDVVAAKAGSAHAQDMARHGFTSHYGTDGSNPELRYTDAGGVHMAQENAGCFADAKERELDSNPRFDPAAIEKVEAAFMAEKPPKDGHRKNILKPWHTHVGVGIAKAQGLPIVCLAQEFVDVYGSYAPIPKQAKRGDKIKVSGSVEAPAKFVGVGLARTDLPAKREPSDLLRTGGYPIPAPFVTYFPKGYVTPIPVEVKGKEFSIEIALTDKPSSPDSGHTGLYEVSVWAQLPNLKDFVMVSLRTLRVPQ